MARDDGQRCACHGVHELATEAGGNEVATTADMALMTDEIVKRCWLLGHSRRTLGLGREVFGFSLDTKAVPKVLISRLRG